MSKLAKTLQAAAGNAGGDKLYVDDVFSTYLYTGTGSAITINNGIALGDSNYGPSVEFDGTSDYLSRSSDMTGNADGKTFTISAWGYRTAFGTHFIYQARTDRFNLYGKPNGNFELAALNSSGSYILEMVIGGVSDAPLMPLNTWTHILISIDLTNTSNRYVYVNDVAYAGSLTYNIYTNDNIDFTRTAHSVGSSTTGSQKWKGRLSNVFLDYTYRDLSVTNNRRLFITADGQPATGLASLSPILYMPLDGSTASVGTNSGTGGDFTVNGSPTVLTQGGPYIESGYGEGGLVWFKSRDVARAHSLWDTERPATSELDTSQTWAATVGAAGITSYNSNGFTIGTHGNVNRSNEDFVSWTFRKSPKCFDIVTWTGDDTTNRTHAHNLGSVPGLIIVKATSRSSNWTCYHRSLGNTKGLSLNSTDAAYNSTAWNSTSPTDTVFTATSGTVNEGGETYVAYVFAHDAGGFGDDGDQDVISCGSFTGNGSTTGPVIDLGYEPQWLMVKNTSVAGNWFLMDNMRGIPMTGNTAILKANTADAEDANQGHAIELSATGFQVTTSYTGTNGNGNTHIYMAIRRPMKTPESGTEVFAPIYSTASTGTALTTNFPVDMQFEGYPPGDSLNMSINDRLRGVSTNATQSTRILTTSSTAAEASPNATMTNFWDNTGIKMPGYYAGIGYISWNFKRAPGFFDMVCYSGTGVVKTEAHNLGVVPELMIVRMRSSGFQWMVYHKDLPVTGHLFFSNQGIQTDNAWNDTAPTDSVFSIKTYAGVNRSADTYVNYLFATLAGVSKVGSYTGTGADLNVDCGFSAGARFILVRRTDSTGDWYVWDSARGISAGNDPYLLLNSTAAEVTSTDYIDPLASGFTVTSSAPAALNASGGTYIFLAIA